MEEHKKDKYASPENRSARQKNSPGKKHVDRRSWKLIADPALGRGQEKVYRFDGVLSGNPVPVLTRDPRFRINRLKLKDDLDLRLPNLKLDEHFVGKLPLRDVTFSGLNDNINEAFLTDMCRPFGEIETLEIFVHPRSGRRLGVARVLYCSVKSARACVERLNNTLKMGKQIQVFLDVGGKQRTTLIDDIVNEVKPVPPPSNEIAETEAKDSKVAETKLDDRPVKNQSQESDSGNRHRHADHFSKSAGHNSLSRRLSSPRHQQASSLRHSEVGPAPVIYPPPPPLVARQGGSQAEPDLLSISEPEHVINSGGSPKMIDKEEGEIGSEESESAESSDNDEGEEAESLEQRIQALLTGKGPKSKQKETKASTPQTAASRSDSTRPVAETKVKQLPNLFDNPANVMPPVVPPTAEPIIPFPFTVPPPPFALPPGIRPPPPAIFVTKEQHGALFASTFEMLVAELRRTLFRDLSRRLLEQCAFRQLDSWWVKNEIRSRATKKPTEESQASSQSTSEQKQQPQTASQVETQTPGLNNIFRQGGLFGLRDALPKLPSFRRKEPPPPPLPPPRNQVSSSVETSSSQKDRLKKISESDDSDNSIADFPVSPKHSDSNSDDQRKHRPDSKKKKVLRSDSDEDSDVHSASSNESSSEEDFSSSSSSSSSSEDSEEESSSSREAEKSDVSMKSPKILMESSRSPQESASLGAANRPTTPANAVKPLSSPVTSPQKPKARWAMFLQEQEQQQQTATGNATSSPASAAQNSAHESEAKQGHSPKGKSKTSKANVNVSTKGQRGKRLKSQAEVTTSESSASESSSDEIDEDSETEVKSKGKKRTPAQTKKTTPARRGSLQAKPRQNSTKVTAKEPLQQQQQQKVAKPATTQPASPRKPVVKRVNTLANVVKEELPIVGDNNNEKCGEPNEENARDPRLPDFLVDHSYVPTSQLSVCQTVAPTQPKVVFKARDRDQEEAIATSFMRLGIDAEDLQYLERSYEELLQNYSQSYYWLNETHWVKHPPTVLNNTLIVENNEGSPRKKRRVATTAVEDGCARCDLQWRGGKVARPHGPAGTETVDVCETAISEGGIDLVRASETVAGSFSATGPGTSNALERLGADIGKTTKAAKAELRDARSHQRRLLACFSSGLPEEKRDILGFNLLKYRKKRVRFARSGIHGWGLYALEPIAAEEMVVEYAGELVRKTVGDLREKKYARLGVDGSYMFRVDEDLIVDATMAGNYGRFINHSCAPNCYAKVIAVDGQKKIVIYSKREIAVSEEITYDYKFPLEPAASKIVCHCAASTCRQTLN